MKEQKNYKKILFVTGTRADYGKLQPLAKAAQEAGNHITFFITGMHMMKRYGETRLEVKKFSNADFFEFVNQKEGDSLELILSKTILGFSDFVHENKPDLVVIHGDRVEAMAASIVCAMRYIRSAHIEGGEISGTIDESIRNCNTKLCATHFVSNETAKKRVIGLGELEDRVFTIGSPELDTHALPSKVSIDEVKKHYNIPFNEYGIVIFHSVTSEVGDIGDQAMSLFDALIYSGRNFVVISPNNDPGTEKIFSVIDSLPQQQFKNIPTMRFHYFSELMKNASVIVGNSSVGVREAPFLGVPSLDIGTRQSNRSTAESVTKASAFDVQKIKDFLDNQWGVKKEKCKEFGSGTASENFIKYISNYNFWKIDLQK